MREAASIEMYGWAVDAPALVLLVLLAAMAWAMRQAQKRPDFDWGEAFRDEITHKVSAHRFAIFVAVAVTSWLLIYVSMNVIKKGDDLDQLFPFFLAYLVVWASAKGAEKITDALLAKVGVRQTPQQ